MRPDAPTPAAPSLPSQALLWALGCLAGGALIGSVLAGIAEAAGDSSTGAGTIAAGELGLWAGMVSAGVLVSRRFATGSLRRDFGYRLGPRDIGPGIGAAVVGLVVAQILSIAFDGTRFAGTNTDIVTGQRSHTSPSFILVTVIVAVGSPIFEELYFRGVLRAALGGLGPHGAIWAQAVLFGLAHYNQSSGLGNVSVMVIVGGLGVVLGYTARAAGRLGPGILAHGTFNAVQVALALTKTT